MYLILLDCDSVEFSISREVIIQLITIVRKERGGLSGMKTTDIINATMLVANRPSFQQYLKVCMKTTDIINATMLAANRPSFQQYLKVCKLGHLGFQSQRLVP